MLPVTLATKTGIDHAGHRLRLRHRGRRRYRRYRGGAARRGRRRLRRRDGRRGQVGDARGKGVSVVQGCAAGVAMQRLRPDGSLTDGIAEPVTAELEGEVVQFERVGFVRLERGLALFLHR